MPKATAHGHSRRPKAVSLSRGYNLYRGVGEKPGTLHHVVLDTGHRSTKELEALCRRCGLCCHKKAQFSSGEVYINPFMQCDWLTEFGCIDYPNRKCLPLMAMTVPDYIMPEGCAYLKLRPGYKPAKVISKEQYLEMLKAEREDDTDRARR